MNRILKNMTVVCLCIILIGVGLAGTGLLLGGTLVFSYDMNSHKILTPKDMKYKMVTDNIDAFKSIDITTDFLDIIIEPGDTYSISYPKNENIDMSYMVENNILTITSKTSHNSIIDFSFNSFDTNQNCITITVPENLALSKIAIQSASGNCEITKQKVDEMNLKLEYGNICLEDCNVKDADFESSDGDFTLNDCQVTKINGNLSYGDCTIKNCTMNENTFDLSDGDLTFQNTKAGNANISMRYGDLSILRSSIDMLTAGLQDGDCTFQMTDNIDSYSTNFFTDDGDIIINGQQKGNQYRCNNSGQKSIDVSTQYGDIEITY